MRAFFSLIASCKPSLLKLQLLIGEDLFPLKLNWLLRLPWHVDRSLPDLLFRFNHQTLPSYEPLALVKRAIPSSLPIRVTELLPRLKDG